MSISVQIQASKTDLERAVKIASIALGAGGDSETDATSQYVFDITTDGRVRVRAGDRLYVHAFVKAPTVLVGGPQNGVAVPGKRLLAFLAGCRDDRMIDIAYDAADRRVVLTSYAVLPGKAPKSTGRGRWMSGDASKGITVDKNLASAQVTTSLEIDRFVPALNYSAIHAAKDVDRKEQLAVVLSRNGNFEATDSNVLAFVSLNGVDLSKSAMHIGRGDVSAVISFLNNFKGKVDLLEHDPATPLPDGTGQPSLFLRNDEALMAVRRWPKEPPPFKVDKSADDKSWFTLDMKDLNEALSALAAFSVKDDKYLYLRVEGDEVVLGMESASGASDNDEWRLPMAAQENMNLFEAEGHKGFFLNRNFVREISAFYNAETIRFGLGWAKKGGWVRLHKTLDNGDDFISLLVWMKK